MRRILCFEIRNNFFNSFDPNSQVSGYSYYCKEKYGRCSGFIPVGMFVGYRQKAYKGEPAGFHCEFDHTIINRTEDQLDDWLMTTLMWVSRLKNDIEFPKDESACHSYRGCGFKELCLSCNDQSVRESLYERYDPFEYLER